MAGFNLARRSYQPPVRRLFRLPGKLVFRAGLLGRPRAEWDESLGPKATPAAEQAAVPNVRDDDPLILRGQSAFLGKGLRGRGRRGWKSIEEVSARSRGLDDLRPPGGLPKALAQSHHQIVDGTIRGFKFPVKQGPRQVFPTKGFPGVLNQEMQQIELVRGEVDPATIRANQFPYFGGEAPARRRLGDHNRPGWDIRLSPRQSPALSDSDPSEDFAVVGCFHDVVVGTEFERYNPVDMVVIV